MNQSFYKNTYSKNKIVRFLVHNMKVKEIDERELSKINVSSDGDISKSVGLPSFESKISNNTKIDSGYYKIDENIFMSIWKFKNIYGGFNSK